MTFDNSLNLVLVLKSTVQLKLLILLTMLVGYNDKRYVHYQHNHNLH